MQQSDDLGEQIDDQFQKLLKFAIQVSHERSGADEVAKALLYFLLRIANSWRSIRTLKKYSEDEEGFIVDAGAILRAMFDAYLQAAFIVSEPQEAAARASDYFEYEHVDRYKQMQKWMAYDNPMSSRLKSSPNREEGEKYARQEYDRIKQRFFIERKMKDGTVKRGPDVRAHWYPGNLREIAMRLGKEEEYDRMALG